MSQLDPEALKAYGQQRSVGLVEAAVAVPGLVGGTCSDVDLWDSSMLALSVLSSFQAFECTLCCCLSTASLLGLPD